MAELPTNLLTEAEAKEKWCPQARVVGESDDRQKVTPGFNRYRAIDGDGHGEMLIKCLGSGCVMWRWKGKRFGPQAHHDEPTGYCGLAGSP